MRLKLTTNSVKQTKPLEYASRFVFGGLVTVLAGAIADRYGPVVGGLFLAFPGIFPAALSLVEKHKRGREEAEGKAGTWSARGEASVEAAGASAGAVGLMGFGGVLWWGISSHGLLPMLLAAGAMWLGMSWVSWWVRERM